MNLYLDEDMMDARLVRLLGNSGHDVQTAADARLTSQSDPVQLAWAIRVQRAILTYNYEDFEELHDLIRDASGSHPGIFIVRKENNPTRDLTEKGIVNAIRKLEAAGVPIRDEYIVLNQWR